MWPGEEQQTFPRFAVVASRQSAINNLRASATIMTLRVQRERLRSAPGTTGQRNILLVNHRSPRRAEASPGARARCRLWQARARVASGRSRPGRPSSRHIGRPLCDRAGAGKNLVHEHVRRFDADPNYPGQQVNHRMAPSSGVCCKRSRRAVSISPICCFTELRRAMSRCNWA